MKTLLVLEGGALRGIYTAGVLDVLLDTDIKIDAIVGVSAGALFGINYVSNQKGRCLRYNLENANNKNYMGFHSLFKTGNIMNEDFCFNKLIYETDPFDFDTFNNSKTKFYCVVTNLETGLPEYKLITDIKNEMEYLRASGSMPLVSKIVEIDGKKYLDGGVSDSVPLEWALKQGYDKIIIVETRVKDYRKKKSNTSLFKLKYKSYPNFINTLENRWITYNKTKEDIIKLDRDKIFVIRPSKLVPIKRIEHDRTRIQEMYDLGVEDAKNSLDDLKIYLKREGKR
ncbi:MAG: patatin family protein [Bacilli bacterium]|nr:patatin family protein [Bacilli bacterium]